MKAKLGKTEIQLAIFNEALNRLLKGEGKFVVSGTRLSMTQLAKESGAGSGTIYYKPYSAFRVRAMELMAEYNSGLGVNQVDVTYNSVEIDSLRNDRDNQKRLKNEYREICDELRTRIKNLCAERGAVEHALYEATLRITELESMFENISGKRPEGYCFEGGERVTLLPRNLQKI